MRNVTFPLPDMLQAAIQLNALQGLEGHWRPNAIIYPGFLDDTSHGISKPITPAVATSMVIRKTSILDLKTSSDGDPQCSWVIFSNLVK